MFKVARYVLLFAAITSSLVAQPAGSELPEITVRLYNYAGAPQDTISSAQRQATQTLLRAGVRLLWLQCTLNEQGSAEDRRCHQVRGPAAIWLRICPAEMMPKGGLPPGVFGFSLMPEQGPAMTAWVYYHRLEELADRIEFRKDLLLGSMMAHELGHLLLGVNSHSTKGIMSLPWERETLQCALQGKLRFTSEQAVKIQFEARRRLGR